MKTEREKIIDAYGSRIIETTQRFSPAEYARMAKRFLRLFGRHLPANKDSRILDVGCGDGHFLYFLKEQGYRQLEGIDASDERLDRCRAHVIPNVHRADAVEWLRRHASSYDVVFCHHVIEHFPDENLYEFAKLLAEAVVPGGQLIVTTPNGGSPWAGYNIYHDLTHCRLFTSDSLTQLLSYAGLDRIQILPEGAVPFDGWSTLRWLVWKIREAIVKLDYLIQVGGTRGNQTSPLIVSPNVIGIATRPQNNA